jgi:Bacteriophage lambda head decoration protein D
MTILTDVAHTADFIIFEEEKYYSRDQVVIDTGVLVPGTVLGKITATGKYVQHAPAAADGSQNAAGILVYGCDATLADQNRAVLTRMAAVNGLKLNWAAAITAPQKATATTALLALGIVIR